MSSNLHLVAGLLHLVQAGVITYLVSQGDMPDWTLTRMKFADVHERSHYQMFALLPAFPALSSMNHLVTYFVPEYKTYVDRTKTNPLQWTEYSLSAGIMTWLIAAMSGITELRTLISLLFMNVVLQALGYMIEKRVADRQDVSVLTFIAWTTFMAIWIPIIISFITTVETSDVPVPDIVYGIVWMLLALYAAFGVNQLLYVGQKISWEQSQRGYIVLSLVSKSLLTWMTYFGLKRSRDDENSYSSQV
jgi:hypothetical protein